MQDAPFWYHAAMLQAASAAFAIMGSIVVFIKNYKTSLKFNIINNIRYLLSVISTINNEHRYWKFKNELMVIISKRMMTKDALNEAGLLEIAIGSKERISALNISIINELRTLFTSDTKNDDRSGVIVDEEHLTHLFNMLNATNELMRLDEVTNRLWKYPISIVFLLLSLPILCSVAFLYWPSLYSGWSLEILGVISAIGLLLGLLVAAVIIVGIYTQKNTQLVAIKKVTSK